MKNYSDEARKRMSEGAVKSNKIYAQNKQEQYKMSPTICASCKQRLPYEKRKNKFCNSSCAAEVNNTKYIKRKKIESRCLSCNKELKRADGRYCNSTCQARFIFNEKITSWLSGNEISLSTIKKYLLEQCNHKCQECGWNKTNPHTNTIPLELHHIDGNSDHNRPENLIILCPNCHSLTSNYKGANKDSKRSYRKKYYDGASTQNRTEV